MVRARMISSGRPIPKGETEQIEQWKKESAEKLLKLQKEWARKRQERTVAEAAEAS